MRDRRCRVHRLELRPEGADGAYPALADAEIVVLDLLTYAGNRDQPQHVVDASPPGCVVEGDIRDPQLVERRSMRQWTRWCTSPPSPTSTGRSSAPEFVPTNVVGTQALLQAALDAGVGPVRARLHRRGLRLDPARLLAETHPLEPNSPYAASKAASTCSAGPTTAPTAWTVVHHPLLQQLRAPPVPREGHPAVRHEPARRRKPCRSTATAATSATGCTSTTTAAASPWSWPAGGPARSTTSAAAPS